MSERRQYSDAEKATILAALDANDGNVKRTARETGVSRSTLRGWAKDRGVNHGVVELRPQKRDDLAGSLEDIAWQIVDLLPSKLPDAQVNHLFTGLGVTLDKLLVLRGQPNQRMDVTGIQFYMPDNGREHGDGDSH